MSLGTLYVRLLGNLLTCKRNKKFEHKRRINETSGNESC